VPIVELFTAQFAIKDALTAVHIILQSKAEITFGGKENVI